MKHMVRRGVWWAAILPIVGLIGYLCTYGHFFLPLPDWRSNCGEVIEVRDFEAFALPPDSGTFGGRFSQTRWRILYPGQVRAVEVGRALSGYGNMSSGLQRTLTSLGYEFPSGCFAAWVPDSSGRGFRWRVAHYPSFLNRLAKDFRIKPVSSTLTDPGVDFQKSFEQADLLEFSILGSDGLVVDRCIVTVDGFQEVSEFFDLLRFVPYDKGSTKVCCCGGDERVRAYGKGDLLGEFTIHHGTSVRWIPHGTDVDLTAQGMDELAAYLSAHVYSKAGVARFSEHRAPCFGPPRFHESGGRGLGKEDDCP